MSTHNIYLYGEIRKNINTFGLKKTILSRAMDTIIFVYNDSCCHILLYSLTSAKGRYKTLYTELSQRALL